MEISSKLFRNYFVVHGGPECGSCKSSFWLEIVPWFAVRIVYFGATFIISYEHPDDHIQTLKLGKTVASIGIDLHQLRNLIRSVQQGEQHALQQTKANSSPGNVPMKLSDLMLQFEHYQASDPRDKIYALFAIARDSGVLDPDYNASLENVYKELTKAMITRWQNLDIICKHHRGIRSFDIPSWVPDWTIERRLPFQWSGVRGTNIQAMSVIREPYNACDSEPAVAYFRQELNQLEVSGLRHDTVKEVIGIDSTGAFNWPLRVFEKLAEVQFDMSFDVSAFRREIIVSSYW